MFTSQMYISVELLQLKRTVNTDLSWAINRMDKLIRLYLIIENREYIKHTPKFIEPVPA